jgi:hypothetical protein
LPPDYIDSEHTGNDRELLEVFYRACLSEGGSADEIHLRGLKAVIALDQSELEGPTNEELEEFALEHGGGYFNCDCQAEADILTRKHVSNYRAVLSIPLLTMTELSPAAQAVLAAYLDADIEDEASVAAALRAAADQVVPWQPEPTEDSVGPTIDYGYAWALFSKTMSGKN